MISSDFKVTLCMAMTLDGHVASPNAAVPSFSTREDRHRLFKLRAHSDLLIIGAGTVRAENLPPLVRSDKWKNWRIRNGLKAHPDGAIISGSGDIPIQSAVFSGDQVFHVVSHVSCPEPVPPHVHWHQYPQPLDLRDMLQNMCLLGYKNMLLEGGPNLAHSFFRDDLISEIHLTLSAVLFGGTGDTGICSGGLFPDPCRFKVKQIEHNQQDVFIHYVRHQGQ